MKKIYILLYLTLVSSLPLWAQTVDIEKISTAKPLQVTGGLNASALFTNGMNASPLNYFLTGYLNLNAFQSVNIPVMINYSDRKVNLSQGYSFNQIGIHPTYKWATAHIGTVNMSFSPYTLNGHQFTGAGVELSPRNWRLQAMSGRLLKGQYQDTLNTGPTFKRNGFGYRIEYNSGKFLLGTTLFKASDHANSIPEVNRIFNSQVINPAENTVAGFHFGTTLFGHLQLNGEYANSLITKDKSPLYEEVRIRSLGGLFQRSNATTESNHAFNIKANYNITATRTIVGLSYERVDPNYRTLGGYYFVNNLVNYTVNISQQLFGNKASLGGSLGIQNDDIRKTSVSKQNRVVANVNAQAQLTDKLQMGFLFSNFRSYKFLNDTYSRIERIPGQIIDTLDYSLVSRTLGYNLSQHLQKSDTRELTLNFNSNYISSQNVHGEADAVKTNIINSTIGLTWKFPARNLGLHTTLTHFYNGIPDASMSGIGPTFGLQKTIKEVLTLSLNSSVLRVAGQSSQRQYLSVNTQFNGGWKINNNNRLNLNAGFVNNQQNSFLNGNLGYNYTF